MGTEEVKYEKGFLDLFSKTNVQRVSQNGSPAPHKCVFLPLRDIT